jgi:purine-binding chemotaxis protein CheW
MSLPTAIVQPADARGGSVHRIRQFATFSLEQLTFGVEVLQVQEVIRYQEMTQVPLASRTVRGLINLRGQIVTAIDMRRRLGMGDLPPGTLPMNVVVRTGDGAVSLLVDEIGDVLELEASQYEAVPETLSGVARELVTGVFKLKDRLLLALDVESAVAVDDQATAGEGVQ